MWANDFPHSDSTWPLSQQLLDEHMAGVDPVDQRRILRDNCVELFGLEAPERSPPPSERWPTVRPQDRRRHDRRRDRRRRATVGDLAIRDGRIVALGDAPGDGVAHHRRRRAASCRPGFVDIHTHYDAQIMWDRTLSCSPWHGVTTVVIGSCGFGVAPDAPRAPRDVVMRTLEKVEGMTYDALAAGLGTDWPFVTYPEYLDAIEAGRLPHQRRRLHRSHAAAAVRDGRRTRPNARPPPTSSPRWRRSSREAMAAGAIGFSTSQAATHHGAGGRPGAEPAGVVRRDRRPGRSDGRERARRGAGGDGTHAVQRRVRRAVRPATACRSPGPRCWRA